MKDKQSQRLYLYNFLPLCEGVRIKRVPRALNIRLLT